METCARREPRSDDFQLQDVLVLRFFLVRASFCACTFSSSSPPISIPIPCPFSPFPTPPTIAPLISPATILTTTLGVSLPLVASITSLSCNCPCVVKFAHSTPARCNICPNSSPSSLKISALEFTISVRGCFFAFRGVMSNGDAVSESRSFSSGMYCSIDTRMNGTVRNGPLKNSNSLIVGRSERLVLRIGCRSVWCAMGMSGLRVEQRMLVATVSWPVDVSLV